MKKILLSTVAVVALGAGAAVAADMAPVVKAPVQVRPACAQFGGFYIGANAGGASYEHHWSDRDGWAQAASTELPSEVHSTKSGFVGGVEGGYNWQSGCTVFGIEVDYDWASLKNNVFATDGQQGAALDTLALSSRLRGIGTARARSGVIVDNLLIYATGGFAFGDFKRSYTLTDNLGGVLGFVSETFSTNKFKWGWTAGFGTEWAISSNWSLKSEVLYAQFERDNKSFNAFLESNPVFLTKRFNHEDNVWISRIGLNYRWGAPVRAAY